MLGINTLWPQGVPTSVPNPELEKKLGTWLSEYAKSITFASLRLAETPSSEPMAGSNKGIAGIALDA
jgi:hypothetical protein